MGAPSRDQLPLFERPLEQTSQARRHAAVGAAPVAREIEALARLLPRSIRLGTSSWAFPGWAGIVYDRRASKRLLSQSGLTAYARHPLLGAAGLDRTYYSPLDVETFRRYAAQVPEGFRFVVKAHALCTTGRLPRHGRHGARSGEANERFLHAGYATEVVVGPTIEGLGQRLGVLVFQFPPQDPHVAGGVERFAVRLHEFLCALPRGPRYAVEIRNPEWLTPDYAKALVEADATHCFTVHPRMPDILEQRRVVDTRSSLVVRWMLGGGRRYEDARLRYESFDRLVDEDPHTRASIAELCLASARASRPSFVIVNNKAEGSAPRSVIRLAERITRSSRARGSAHGRTRPSGGGEPSTPADLRSRAGPASG
jgi:uncharacterized protein YecE (DUF72 family)